jgi:acetate kinase
MGTRSGDIDPALGTLLARSGLSPDAVDELLNRQSGLLGISGVSADFRDVEAAADAGNTRAKLAIEVFVHRIRKYIGAYAAVLGGIDALVFTGGIGENSARVRRSVCDGLLFMGIALDESANGSARPRKGVEVVDIAAHRAPTRVLVVGTDEERMDRERASRSWTLPRIGPRRVSSWWAPTRSA